MLLARQTNSHDLNLIWCQGWDYSRGMPTGTDMHDLGCYPPSRILHEQEQAYVWAAALGWRCGEALITDQLGRLIEPTFHVVSQKRQKG